MVELKPLSILLSNALLAACSNSGAPPYPPTPASVPPAAQQASQTAKEPTARDVYELREVCAKDAAEWFKRNYTVPPPASVHASGSSGKSPPEYQNHYSQTHNGCFAIVTQSTSFQAGRSVMSRSLYDVNENSKLGSYTEAGAPQLPACDFLGTTCASKDQWLAMARTYIAD